MFQFESFSDFLHMQGHGVFVWWAYAISLLVMIWLLLSPWLQLRRLRQQLGRQHRRAAVAPNLASKEVNDASRAS